MYEYNRGAAIELQIIWLNNLNLLNFDVTQNVISQLISKCCSQVMSLVRCDTGWCHASIHISFLHNFPMDLIIPLNYENKIFGMTIFPVYLLQFNYILSTYNDNFSHHQALEISCKNINKITEFDLKSHKKPKGNFKDWKQCLRFSDNVNFKTIPRKFQKQL